MDLNLVRVFVAVYETRSLTLAGERLYVTQSAISQSLGRLREQFDDPLFQRSGREMNPTPLAEQIFPSFKLALSAVDRALDDVRCFDAESTERVFRVALSELGEIGWLPIIYEAMHRQAPNARLEVVSLVVSELEGWLNRGTVDLAITPAEVSGSFERQHIKWQSYALIMSTRNPLSQDTISVDDYRNAPRVAVAGDSGAGFVDAAQKRAGIVVNPKLTIQNFATLPHLISESTSLFAVVPASIAQGWAAKWEIAIQALPFEMPPIELNLYRRQSSDNTAALDWFYTVVGKAVAGQEGDFSAIQGAQGSFSSQGANSSPAR